MALDIESTQQDGWWIVHPHGEIDIATVSELRAALDSAAAADQRQVIIDLGDVNFMDSTALGAMVEAHLRLTNTNGALRIASPNSHVQRVFDLTGLAEMLGVCPTLEDALMASPGSR